MVSRVPDVERRDGTLARALNAEQATVLFTAAGARDVGASEGIDPIGERGEVFVDAADVEFGSICSTKRDEMTSNVACVVHAAQSIIDLGPGRRGWCCDGHRWRLEGRGKSHAMGCAIGFIQRETLVAQLRDKFVGISNNGVHAAASARYDGIGSASSYARDP